ncbi:hypothetical protein AMS68_006879 [Peltaster fructicola]|uniref:Uncharacterized protein n=1 Tax=Peltaster fructicola TaxID=286661 RepID=A0A6H0Y2W5_9PEZI|nr:hypothetical protein AMS68_006879 [Peltaster fructicola]
MASTAKPLLKDLFAKHDVDDQLLVQHLCYASERLEMQLLSKRPKSNRLSQLKQADEHRRMIANLVDIEFKTGEQKVLFVRDVAEIAQQLGDVARDEDNGEETSNDEVVEDDETEEENSDQEVENEEGKERNYDKEHEEENDDEEVEEENDYDGVSEDEDDDEGDDEAEQDPIGSTAGQSKDRSTQDVDETIGCVKARTAGTAQPQPQKDAADTHAAGVKRPKASLRKQQSDELAKRAGITGDPGDTQSANKTADRPPTGSKRASSPSADEQPPKKPRIQLRLTLGDRTHPVDLWGATAKGRFKPYPFHAPHLLSAFADMQLEVQIAIGADQPPRIFSTLAGGAIIEVHNESALRRCYDWHREKPQKCRAPIELFAWPYHFTAHEEKRYAMDCILMWYYLDQSRRPFYRETRTFHVATRNQWREDDKLYLSSRREALGIVEEDTRERAGGGLPVRSVIVKHRSGRRYRGYQSLESLFMQFK